MNEVVAGEQKPQDLQTDDGKIGVSMYEDKQNLELINAGVKGKLRSLIVSFFLGNVRG